MAYETTPRHWALFFALASAAILAAVYVGQFSFGLHPCHLCLIERLPYFITLCLGIAIVAQPGMGRAGFLLLALVFLGSFGLGLVHWGVENKWWVYESGCTASAFKPGASTADFLAALRKAPSVRCDEAVPFLFGMSMAFYNMLVSFGLFALSVYAAVKKPLNRT